MIEYMEDKTKVLLATHEDSLSRNKSTVSTRGFSVLRAKQVKEFILCLKSNTKLLCDEIYRNMLSCSFKCHNLKRKAKIFP